MVELMEMHTICNFLLNSPKGTIFLYSLDTTKISKIAKKIFEMIDKVVDKVREKMKYK